MKEKKCNKYQKQCIYCATCTILGISTRDGGVDNAQSMCYNEFTLKGITYLWQGRKTTNLDNRMFEGTAIRKWGIQQPEWR